MNKYVKYIGSHITELVFIFLVVYITLPFLSPVLFKVGADTPARVIQRVYKALCHQRVERSIFLFGKDSLIATYSVKELEEKGVVPVRKDKVNSGPFYDTLYAPSYPYWGNDEVGYKVAICIRDIGLYIGLVGTGGVLLFLMKRNKKFYKQNWKILVILMFPMVVDGVFQTIAEIMNWKWIPGWYFTDNIKRVITGGLFGIGFGLFVFPNLKESSDVISESDEVLP